jgi:hypothetical protein
MGMPPFEIQITTDITDVQKLIRTLAAVEKYQIPQIIKRSVKRMERDIKKTIRTGSRSGEHYSGLPNRSSAPGEPPKTQSGRLASSIKSMSRAYPKEGRSFGQVISNAPYSQALEYGATRKMPSGKTWRIEPRPFMRPAIHKEIPNIVDDIIDALR